MIDEIRPYKVRTRRAILVERGLSYCYECQGEKPLDAFYLQKSGTNVGRPTARCKECTAAWSRQWQQADPVRNCEATKRSARKLRLEVLNHYSHGTLRCACCGESRYEFLQLDHMNNDGSKHRESLGQMRRDSPGGPIIVYRDVKRRGFPKGFQVLCANCNSARGWHGRCPHTTEVPTYELCGAAVGAM